jgi:hypothetical protein
MPGANDPIGRGINTIDQTFWFEVTDADGYVWDLLGRYREMPGDILITEIRVGAADESTYGPKHQDPELHRRLTRVQPIKSRIRRQIAEDRARYKEAVAEGKASGRPVGVLEDWANRLVDSQRRIKPWRSRYPDSEWAEWALDYLDRVRAQQSTYGVLRGIAEEGGWGKAKYETVRARLRTMREYEWIVAEGSLVKKGPRLLRWLENRKDENDG